MSYLSTQCVFFGLLLISQSAQADETARIQSLLELNLALHKNEPSKLIDRVQIESDVNAALSLALEKNKVADIPTPVKPIDSVNTREYKLAYQEALNQHKGLVVWVQANEKPGIFIATSKLIGVRLQSFDGAGEGDYVFASNRGDWLERLETVHQSQLNNPKYPIGSRVYRTELDDCPTGN